MKYILQISGQKVLLNQQQLDTITAALVGAEQLKDEYRGRGAGDDGKDYAKVIRPYDSEELMQLTVMDDGRYEAIKLKTKLENQQ